MENHIIQSTLKEKDVHSLGRETIPNAYNFMNKEEADNNHLIIPLSKARERTAAAVSVSERSVSQVNSNFKKLK